jgi:hypothetical protein
MGRILAIFMALAAVAGCVENSGLRGVSGVASISAAEAARCTYVMDITSKPSVYGPLAQQGLEASRNQVMGLARDNGANAVVFVPVSPGALVTEIQATAYRC